MVRIYGATSVTSGSNIINQGVVFSAKTQEAGSTPLTIDGIALEKLFKAFVVPENAALIFDATIGAVTTSGSAAGLWRFAGLIRRETTTYSTKLVGVTTPTVVADSQFAQTYVEVYENTSIGALMISVSGAPNTELYWNASVRIKEIK